MTAPHQTQGLVQPPQDWLCQGDVFRSVPLIIPALNQGTVVASVNNGPALVLTHGCAMDKPTRDGRPRIEFLTVAPLLSLAVQDNNRQTLLRKQAAERQPYEVLYLGEVADFGEAYVSLSETALIPASLFQPVLQAITLPGEAEPSNCLVPTVNGDRVATLTASHLELLLDKMMTFWTRREGTPVT